MTLFRSCKYKSCLTFHLFWHSYHAFKNVYVHLHICRYITCTFLPNSSLFIGSYYHSYLKTIHIHPHGYSHKPFISSFIVGKLIMHSIHVLKHPFTSMDVQHASSQLHLFPCHSHTWEFQTSTPSSQRYYNHSHDKSHRNTQHHDSLSVESL